MLLGQFLSSGDIRKEQIIEEAREVRSEQSVAEAVKNGRADAGICTSAAASEAGLSFAPLRSESHILVIRKDALDDGRVQALLQVAQSSGFKHQLAGQGWYDTTSTGRVRDLQKP
jgi:putative molybdopterin biosynthesis protein